MTLQLQDHGILNLGKFSPSVGDDLHIVGNATQVTKCTFFDDPKDLKTDKAKHRDACQVIAITQGWMHSQYAAAPLSWLWMTENRMLLKSKKQGIFAADGYFDQVTICDNVIETESDHKITFCGLRSGLFQNNIDMNGDPVRVLLEPLRIGGAGVWVTDFTDPKYDFLEVEGENIIDNRQKVTYPGHIYLRSFDLDAFRNAAQKIPTNDTATTCKAYQALAQQFGTRYN